jgi:sterol desaturase/sphingolipid hydroxylase (fatty acid hydroxylase superfamily)
VDIIAASIPLFFLLIGLELAAAWWRGDRVYRLNDSISDLSCGILSQLAGLFTKFLLLGIYAWAFEALRAQRWLAVPEWPAGAPWADGALQWGAALSWTVAFVATDFAYYWTHRLSHEVNLLWAGHVVHHSSEEYNLTVALRQSSLHGLFTWVFYVPLALAGIPWGLFATSYALNLVYQFWIHTREIRTLGRPLEAVLNTPSHHRVHHGVNPEYQDRNYAGVFIVWDRLFGTFVPERAEPVYGLTKPLRSFNPLWANVHVFWEIIRGAWRAPTRAEKRRIIFGRPSEQPGAEAVLAAVRDVTPETFEKFDPPAARPVQAYAFVQFVAALVASVALLEVGPRLPAVHAAALVFYVGLTLANLGGLLERQRWAATSEFGRLVALGVAGVAFLLGAGSAAAWVGPALLAPALLM